MAEALIEQQRRLYETVERLEQTAAELLVRRVKTHRLRLHRDHCLRQILRAIQENSQRLLGLYTDESALLLQRQESAALNGGMEVFVQKLKEIQQNHLLHPQARVESVQVALDAWQQDNDVDLEALFSGEEGWGRYVDLHAFHEQFINLPGQQWPQGELPSYISYLDNWDNFEQLSAFVRQSASYLQYLKALESYLEGFIRRAQPLHDTDAVAKQTRTAFEQFWKNQGQTLYCEACQKRFTKQTLFDAHLTGRKHLNAASRQGSNSGNQGKQIAECEWMIKAWAHHLASILDATKANVERKQTMTAAEREEEWDDVDMVIDYSSSEDEANGTHNQKDGLPSSSDEKIYNPLKLPLGWDGKPIPFWLYKLHQLGVEFPCEICGNFVYMGRRAFERHFQEWRHSYGMKCLGIPNTKQFFEITKIDDAYSLHEKLKQVARVEQFHPDAQEEFEDEQGNVFNKRTYEDLKRQGLI